MNNYEQLDDIFSSTGLFSKHFQNYETRPQQQTMARHVLQSIEESKVSLIEGATGVGKSFGYLVPILMNGSTAIVSTSNKNLQDQLHNKDLPTLQKILPVEVNWTTLKGKSNYFCHHQFHVNEDEIKRLMSRSDIDTLMTWLEKDGTGDMERCPIEIDPHARNLMTCGQDIKHEKDSQWYDMCFANRARERARNSRVVLVNHSLLALDLVLRQESDGQATILPDMEVMVIDEAHKFEEAASQAFSDTLNRYSLTHFLRYHIVQKACFNGEDDRLLRLFESAVEPYIPEIENGYYVQREVKQFETLIPVIETLEDILDNVRQDNSTDERLLTYRKEVISQGNNLVKRLKEFSLPTEYYIRWTSARESKKKDLIVTMNSAPIDIAPLLSNALFSEERPIIFTSATLSINKSFSFFRSRLGVPKEATELVCESPFDFKTNSLIYITKGENDQMWELEQLLTHSRGRAFVLFTSYKAMNDAYRQVRVPYPTFIQETGESRSKILESFRTTKNAVLFGTKSFWEGVDIQGEQLSLVIIHKLPFPNFADLLYKNRIDRIEKKLGTGKHWFTYTIPVMCLDVKQGVGRLIRSKEDTGVIAILDARLNTKNYRNMVIGSLPDAYRTQKLENVKLFFDKLEAKKGQ